MLEFSKMEKKDHLPKIILILRKNYRMSICKVMQFVRMILKAKKHMSQVLLSTNYWFLTFKLLGLKSLCFQLLVASWRHIQKRKCRPSSVIGNYQNCWSEIKKWLLWEMFSKWILSFSSLDILNQPLIKTFLLFWSDTIFNDKWIIHCCIKLIPFYMLCRNFMRWY